IFLLPSSIPRALAALAFLIFSPGYSIVELVITRKNLDIIETIALSVGLSIVVIPLIAFIINFTVGHFETPIVVSVLALFSISISIFSVYKMRKASSIIINKPEEN